MNKVTLMGRLVRDPEVRYSPDGTTTVARYSLAVEKKYKRQGESDADYISCVTFGKSAQFIEKYVRKGQRIVVYGRLQTRSWEDEDHKKRYATEVITEEHYFADSLKNREAAQKAQADEDGFYPIDDTIEDSDLPF
ncbi:MAG: single-stranded DNA-binding protein [Lachnospiraceae bacterium]|nr:single-stranded DNA-binding protein [Lachnospiraceae bacterium]